MSQPLQPGIESRWNPIPWVSGNYGSVGIGCSMTLLSTKRWLRARRLAIKNTTDFTFEGRSIPMKTIDLTTHHASIEDILQLAEQQHLFVRTPEGKVFVVAEVEADDTEDDFAQEVAFI